MRKIAEDVYQLPLMPRNSVNAYLIGNVLIDAGIRSSWKTILRQLDSRKVKAHALTHAHADHQGSSHEICRHFDVPLWCSPAEKWQAESGNATAEYPAQNHPMTWFQKKYWAGPGHPVSRELREGDRVAGFEVINTPGHSGGHLSFFRPEDRILIVGDVLVNMNLLTTLPGLDEPPHLFTKNAALNRKSIRKLEALKPKVMAFGHGPVLYNHGDLEDFLKTLKD